MRIILIYDFCSEYGGTERVIAAHARWLKKAGHEVTLLFSHVDPKTAEYFHKGSEIKEVSTIKIGGETVKLFSSLLGLNGVKKVKEADLVIAYSFPSLYLVRKLKCKKAFYYLPMEFIYFNLKKRWEWANDVKRKAAFFASLGLGPVLKYLDKKWIKDKIVIANSEFTQREIKGRYNVDAFVSYPPLNKIFKPTINKIMNNFILTAGRIVPDKRTDWLIEIFAKLKDKKLQFFIAGAVEEKYKQSLITLATKLGVKKRVKFLGLVKPEALAILYSSCRCFVFASPEEAFGLGPVEAMACGASVVAWDDKAGPNEYVINGVNGYRVRPYDLDEFAHSIETLLKFPLEKKLIIDSIKKFSEKEQKRKFLKIIKETPVPTDYDWHWIYD